MNYGYTYCFIAQSITSTSVCFLLNFVLYFELNIDIYVSDVWNINRKGISLHFSEAMHKEELSSLYK